MTSAEIGADDGTITETATAETAHCSVVDLHTHSRLRADCNRLVSVLNVFLRRFLAYEQNGGIHGMSDVVT